MPHRQTLWALLGRLTVLYAHRLGRRAPTVSPKDDEPSLPRLVLGTVMLVILVFLLLYPLTCERPLRVATFNIENFPKNERQIEGAFAEMKSLKVDMVGVQEITDRRRFAREAQKHLGHTWRFAHADYDGRLGLGVLYRSNRFVLISARTRNELIVRPGTRPAFEARFLSRYEFGPPLRVIVVHLKAMGDGVDIRRKQYAALRPIVEQAVASGDRVVLLGDFNATSEADRAELEALSSAAKLKWATKDMACTSFWSRDDGCFGSALDHMLTTEPYFESKARGPCQSEGCDRKDQCPIFHREVSDHCPITLDF